jgi:predicted dehydrogenase
MPIKKVIVVGAGRWSNKMHLPAILPLVQKKQIEVCAVCDLNLMEAKLFAEKVNCNNISADFGELVSEFKPDGAILLVTPVAMPNLIKSCINLKLPFISEKPPATDSTVHRQLMDSIGELPHIIGFNRRFAPFIRQAFDWSSDKKIDSISCDFTRINRVDEDFSTTYIHALDAVIYLSGSEPEKFSAEIQYKENFENIFLSGTMKNGVYFQIQILPNVASSRERYSLRGPDLSVDISFSQGVSIDSPGYVERHQNDRIAEHKAPYDYLIPFDDFVSLGGFTAEHQAFSEILNKKKHQTSTLQNTLASQQIRDLLCAAVKDKTLTVKY